MTSLPARGKRAVRLMTAEGAGPHDQPIGPQVGQGHVFGSLDRVLGI